MAQLKTSSHCLGGSAWNGRATLQSSAAGECQGMAWAGTQGSSGIQHFHLLTQWL